MGRIPKRYDCSKEIPVYSASPYVTDLLKRRCYSIKISRKLRKTVNKEASKGSGKPKPSKCPQWSRHAVRTRMCSRLGPHACDRIAQLRDVNLPGDA
ncbi:hypothetical protein CRG98_003308 [Punica granatum]|uniref:Uncharacterized protein n=1 Tax=Punica granatum TaxID=22663 RepID=A0A2I0L6G6_PUNGR|nr:hypothetical protein CRG98_003308 [Punica granatum]